MLVDNLRTVPTVLEELEYLLVPMALNKPEPQRMELMAKDKVNSTVDWTLDWPKQHLQLRD